MAADLLFDSSPQDGGGYYEGLNTVLELNNRIEIKVFVLNKKNLKLFTELGIPCEKIKFGFYNRLSNKIESNTLIPLASNRFLSSKKIHFISPSRIILSKKIGIFSGTIWDLCHIDSPYFPEVGSYKEYNYRNYLLERYISRMNFVVADSDENSLKLEKYFRIPQERILVLPFSIPKASADKPVPEVEKLGNFFFYPAQLWKHKNHKNLLYAFEKLLQHRLDYSLILTGSHRDSQVLKDVINSCDKYPDNVKYLGFVDYDSISWLYKRCSALIYPSFFGPTNIPPLEAISAGSDVILSDTMEKEIGNVATYFDPNDPESIFEKLLAHTLKQETDDTIKQKFIIEYDNRRQTALDALANKLVKQTLL